MLVRVFGSYLNPTKLWAVRVRVIAIEIKGDPTRAECHVDRNNRRLTYILVRLQHLEALSCIF